MKMALRLKEDSTANKTEDTEELLVFGYSCKLFRDDEKALFIDQGKHLIPWMGDETLKIDRYDARGTLFDLKHVEAPSGGYDRFIGLTDKERQVETMCDEERYRALFTNEEEESMYQEEELKRLHYAIGEKGKSYGQVEYKYDGNSNNVEEPGGKTNAKSDDGGDDEPFVPSPQLDIPLNMVLPETVKHNAIIEKTAMFICDQGPQMEILLKMKQAGNPQFNFLSFDNPLHQYYRHLLMAIKGGRYKPQLQDANAKKDLEDEDDEDGDDDHYLHPSLASSVSKVELAPSIPSINYKPSAHCAYSMLVNKIKDKKINNSEQLLPSHLSKLKQALERFRDDKKSEDGSGNESDSSGSFHSKLLKNPSLGNNVGKASVHSFETPPKDMQIIIDKMASYVAKNGRDFEIIVQSKKDPRFNFLNSSHSFHAYYQHKVKQYENIEKPGHADERNKANDASLKMKEEQSKGKLAPVCFSIKKPKESETVIEKSALPVEESSDEEGKDEKYGAVAPEKEKEKEKERETKDEIVTVDLAAMEEKEEKNKKILAAERLKDKLTAVVRGKVATASKEKQLQLERKRRAAAFLKTIQPDAGGVKAAPLYGPLLPGVDIVERVTDDDSDVTSLPEALEDTNDEHRNEKGKKLNDNKRKASPTKYTDEKHEKRHRSSSSNVRHKHKEKHSSKIEKREKSQLDESRLKDGSDRISVSSSSSDENECGKAYLSENSKTTDKRRKVEETQWRNKCDKIRSLRKEDKRHKRKKHKKDDGRDRTPRKHSKSKKQKRSRGSDDDKGSRSKRHRRKSDSSSEGPDS